jgi:hypothetical protein
MCLICIGPLACVATPLWPSVGVKPNTSKVGDLESFGTPECLELDNKAQCIEVSLVSLERS